MYTGWQQKRRVRVRVRKKNRALASISFFLSNSTHSFIDTVVYYFQVIFSSTSKNLNLPG